MHEVIEQLLSYLRGIWRQRWYALLVAWAICLLGWAFVLRMPDQYQATTRVQVDTYSILQPLLQDMTVNVANPEHVRQLQQTMLSRPNLEKIVRAAELDLKADTPAEFEDVMTDLQKNIEFRRAGEANLYTISYKDPDPAQAKKIVQALLNLFIEQALGDSRQDTDSAERFLERQIEEYTQRLQDSETRLKAFKRKNLGLMPEQGKDYYTRLQESLTKAEEAELELRQAENLAAELKNQLSGEDPTFGMVAPARPSANVAEIDGRISKLQQQLDELLMRYTDQHPDVQNLRNRIADLDQQKVIAVKAGGSNSSLPMDANPVYQQLKISAGEAAAKVAGLRVRVADYRARAEELQRKMHVLPQVEQDLAQLARDYDVTKENYDKLIAKRESARISRERDRNTSDISFKVIDPPRVPPEPVGPNRTLFLSAVLGAGLAAGFAVALLISQILSTFDNPRILMSTMQVPVLGTVSLILSAKAEKMRRMKNLLFFGLCTAILPVYALLLYLQVGTASVVGS